MNKVCVLCHSKIPNTTDDKLISSGYSIANFDNPKLFSKPKPRRKSYFCPDHTSKEKADAIWGLMNYVEPYKYNRFEHIID